MKRYKLNRQGIFSYSEMGFRSDRVATIMVKDGWVYLGLGGKR